MKKIFSTLLLTTILCGCAKSYATNQAVGAVASVNSNIPLLCPRFYDTNIILEEEQKSPSNFTIENSKWFYVKNSSDKDLLLKASEEKKLVSFKYDIYNTNFCVESNAIKDVKILD